MSGNVEEIYMARAAVDAACEPVCESSAPPMVALAERRSAEPVTAAGTDAAAQILDMLRRVGGKCSLRSAIASAAVPLTFASASADRAAAVAQLAALGLVVIEGVGR